MMPDLDLDLNLANTGWTLMFLVAFGVTLWNAWDGWVDWRSQVRLNRRPSRVLAARWFCRQDAFKSIALACFAGAGLAAMFRVPDAARDLLFFGAAVLTANQFINRIERNLVMEIADIDAQHDEELRRLVRERDFER